MWATQKWGKVKSKGRSGTGAETQTGDGMESVGTLQRMSRRLEGVSRLRPSTLTWSNEVSGDGMGCAGGLAEGRFEEEMLGGLDWRLAERSWTLFRNRGRGMMGVGGGDGELARGVEDVRLRQEHVERSVVQMPMLVVEGGRRGEGWAEGVRRSVFWELRDLYVIVMSMETRKYDLGVGDVKGLFEWFVVFERCLRVYLWVAEKHLFKGIDGAVERRREKRRIVGEVVRVERMRRVMLAEGMKGMAELRRRVDEMSMRVVRYMNEEVAVVGGVVEAGRVEEGWRNMVTEIRGMAGGKEVVGILMRGADVKWVYKICGRWFKARWLWAVVDRHGSYATMFAQAEKEYKAIYQRLCGLVDDELKAIGQHSALE